LNLMRSISIAVSMSSTRLFPCSFRQS
jgi:hypothetical protein